MAALDICTSEMAIAKMAQDRRRNSLSSPSSSSTTIETIVEYIPMDDEDDDTESVNINLNITIDNNTDIDKMIEFIERVKSL